jgi:hypothetical protein
MGRVSWYLEVASVRIEKRRATDVPAAEDVRRMLATSSSDNEAETRGTAILMVGQIGLSSRSVLRIVRQLGQRVGLDS